MLENIFEMKKEKRERTRSQTGQNTKIKSLQLTVTLATLSL